MIVSSYFILDGRLEAEIEKVVGADRFAPYLSVAGTRLDALKLYSWNSALAAAFLGPIALVEVGVRNAIAGQLRATYGTAWYDSLVFLGLDAGNRTRDSIATAKGRIGRAVPPRPIVDGRVVAELSLSFWVYLLRPALNRSLWPLLRPGFNRYAHRKTLVRYLEPLTPFRNRVAHHEAIYDRRPREMYEGLLQIASMVSDDLAPWIEHHSRVRRILSRGPVSRGIKF